MSSGSPFRKSDEIFSGEMRRLAERERLIQQVMQHLSEHGCALDEYFDRLCLDESLSNAILHGNRGDPQKRVKVRAFCRDDRWAVEIADEGPGFDWQSLLEGIREGLDPYSPSGRGIALILASGARVDFLDGGSRLLISRKREP